MGNVDYFAVRHCAGRLIAYLTKDVGFLSWMNFGQTFGLTEPVTLDLGILVLTFGLTIRITMGSIIGLILGIILYKLM